MTMNCLYKPIIVKDSAIWRVYVTAYVAVFENESINCVNSRYAMLRRY